jgi:hypothetical protein
VSLLKFSEIATGPLNGFLKATGVDSFLSLTVYIKQFSAAVRKVHIFIGSSQKHSLDTASGCLKLRSLRTPTSFSKIRLIGECFHRNAGKS